MPFTHERPEADRYYDIAYSTASANAVLNNTGATDESYYVSLTSTYNSSRGSTQTVKSSEYAVISFGSNNGSYSSAVSASSFGSTSTSTGSQVDAGRTEGGTGSGVIFRDPKVTVASGSSVETFYLTNAIVSSGQTANGSTSVSFFYEANWSQSIESRSTYNTSNDSRSGRIVTSNSAGDTFYSVTQDFRFGWSSYYGLSRTVRGSPPNSVGGNWTMSTTTSSSFAYSNNNGGNDDNGGDTGTKEYAADYDVIKTLLTQFTFEESTSFTTTKETLTQTFTVKSLDASNLRTAISTYEYDNTTTVSSIINVTYTDQGYETESILVTEFRPQVYDISTIYGAAWIGGGSTLPNLAVTGASEISTIGGSESQITTFNSFSFEYYKNTGSPQITTYRVGSVGQINVVTTATTDKQDTRIIDGVEFTPSVLDFGINFYEGTDEFPVYTNQSTTYNSRYTDTTTSDREVLSILPVERENVFSTVFEGFVENTADESKTFIGSDGFSSFLIIGKTSSYKNYTTYFGLSGTNTSASSSRTLKISRGTAITSNNLTNAATLQPRLTVLTYDKGNQGGIQYDYESDISDAARMTAPISITDALPTTTTSQQSDTRLTNTFGVNTDNTKSYTLTNALPLTFLRLNRYYKYIPTNSFNNGNINGIVTGFKTITDESSSTIYESTLGSVENIYVENGRSIIRFSSSGSYLTTSLYPPTRTDQTTKSFSTLLTGAVENSRGNSFAQGQQTAVKYTQFFNDEINMCGGQIFTDREGVLIFSSNLPPLTFKIFNRESADDETVTLSSTDGVIGFENTISLPANGALFINTAPIVTAAYTPRTYQRK